MKKKLAVFIFILFFSQLFSEEFTIAVIPDSQMYVDYRYQKDYSFSDIYFEQVQYIVDNAYVNGGDIVFSIHLGDLVNNYSLKDEEWKLADKGISFLDGVMPYGLVIGNHDYDVVFDYFDEKLNKNLKIIAGSTKFDEYFGPESKHFKDKSWYIESSEEGRNSCQMLTFGSVKVLFIELEIEPSDRSLNWAQKIINKYKNVPVILSVHEYLTTTVDEENNAKFCNGTLRYLYNHNTAKNVCSNFVLSNPQIFLVLCGHYGKGDEGEGSRKDINKDKYDVVTLLSDYQYRKNMFAKFNSDLKPIPCGDGWLRLLTINTDKTQIKVKTYSTLFNEYEVDEDSDFTISYNWDWKERFGGIK